MQNVLFLCAGNSAQSILAEATLNREGAQRFDAFAAGSHPKGQGHPVALALPAQLGPPTEKLRSKSWDEFAARNARLIHFVITVCNNAAGEDCLGQVEAFQATCREHHDRIQRSLATETFNG